MSTRLETLAAAVDMRLSGRVKRAVSHTQELTYDVEPGDLLDVSRALRDESELKFEMLMDVCGIDYLHYGHDEWKTYESTGRGFSRGVARGTAASGAAIPEDARERFDPPVTDLPASAPGRFAAVYHLLSIAHNWRLRLRCRCPIDEQPMLDSVADIWSSANWFEREAFDLYGILFRGHPDLRRLLTDYGFIGHPFRKDFPLIGNAEVRYDSLQGRVIYQPVSIEPRVLVPKVIRDESFRKERRYQSSLKETPVGGRALPIPPPAPGKGV